MPSPHGEHAIGALKPNLCFPKCEIILLKVRMAFGNTGNLVHPAGLLQDGGRELSGNGEPNPFHGPFCRARPKCVGGGRLRRPLHQTEMQLTWRSERQVKSHKPL